MAQPSWYGVKEEKMAVQSGLFDLQTARAVATVSVGVAVVVGGLYASGLLTPAPESAPDPVIEMSSAPSGPVPAPTTEQLAETTETALPEPLMEPDPTPELVVVQPEPEPAPLDPLRFNVVRAEADGTTLVAGSGPAGADLVLLLDEEPFEKAIIDRFGEFVMFLKLEPSPYPRQLSLRATLGDVVVLSEEDIILAPVSVQVAKADTEPESTPVDDPVPAESEPVVSERTEADPTPATPREAVPVDVTDSIPAAAIKTDTPAPTKELANVDVTERIPSAPTSEPVTREDSPPGVTDSVPSAPVEPPTELASVNVTGGIPEASVEPKVKAFEPPTRDPTELASVDHTDSIPAISVEGEAADVTVSHVMPAPSIEDITNPPAEPGPGLIVAKLPQPVPSPASTALDTPGIPIVVASTPIAPIAGAPNPRQPSVPVAVLRSTKGGVELLQSATKDWPVALDQLVLDTISYSELGEVQLAGRAVADTTVRVYLNNELVADIDSDDGGRWRGMINGIEPGVYALRLDALDSAGRTVSRLETPFQREDPAKLAEAIADDNRSALIRAVTVQKGDTLWAISRDRYGEGILYVRVFEANQNQIRDPDLIYPGQVFAIPE